MCLSMAFSKAQGVWDSGDLLSPYLFVIVTELDCGIGDEGFVPRFMVGGWEGGGVEISCVLFC